MFLALRTLVYGDGSTPAEHHETWYWKKVQRLAAYPIILVIGWLPATVNRVHNSASDDSLFALAMVQIVSQNLIGTFNAFAYGFTDNLLVKVRSAWHGEEPEDCNDDGGEVAMQGNSA